MLNFSRTLKSNIAIYIMKHFLKGLLLTALFLSQSLLVVGAEKSRALWACLTADGKNVFVSWRMRATDSPLTTTYNLYADGNLVSSSKEKTNVTLSNSYSNSTFSLEVLDNAGNKIDEQAGVKVDAFPYHHIKLQHPADYKMTTTGNVVVYEPNDCSAYDMDGDGEQEIIVAWFANIGATAAATAPPILDCYKLDGSLMWRINLGPNILGGCRFSFLCYDFDGDGYGEVITKTAPGTKDATGSFLSKGVANGANHYASSINGSGVITDGGKEWLSCFSGLNGKELATIDYWPYFNIQKDWDDRSNSTDGSTYGHRGNWLKGCVATLPVNGVAKPCAVTNRGIYTYVYAAAYTWDGKNLTNLWRHSSDQRGQGLYAEGAHSITCGDVDGDGYDEVIIGASCLDHNGKVLWRTGFGHGDATHLGEFDPSNPGLEYYMITEEGTAKYDCALLDAKTGKVLYAKNQSGGDTGRGLILDCDDKFDGAEIMVITDNNLLSCKGQAISAWHVGSTNSSSINGRIFWDGDLLEEYTDRGHVDKWDSNGKSWGRLYTFGYKINVNGKIVEWGANTNNSTKYNPCLQADLIGDWREESIFWTAQDGSYYITIYSSTYPSDYKLPWLRDDHVYDMAVAWQHCGYNQPPHLGYSPVEYYKNLQNMGPATIGRWGSGGARNQTVEVGASMTTTVYNFTNCASVKVVGTLPSGVTATVANNQIKIGGTPTESGVFQYSLETVGAFDGNDFQAVGGTITVPYTEPAELTKHGEGASTQEVMQNKAIAEFSYSWENAAGVTVTGLPEGIEFTIDESAKMVSISGVAKDEPGAYTFTVESIGNDKVASKSGTIVIIPDNETGVNNESSASILVAPNPMSEFTQVVVPSHSGEEVFWQLSGLSGCIFGQGNILSAEDNNTIEIQRNDLPAGMYILHIVAGNERFNVKIVVK